MNKEELDRWLRDYPPMCGSSEYDNHTNKWGYTVHQIGDKLYRVDYCNGFPCKSLKLRNDERPYLPYPVKAVTRTIVDYVYEDAQ